MDHNNYQSNAFQVLSFGVAEGSAVFWPKPKLWPNLRFLAETESLVGHY